MKYVNGRAFCGTYRRNWKTMRCRLVSRVSLAELDAEAIDACKVTAQAWLLPADDFMI